MRNRSITFLIVFAIVLGGLLGPITRSRGSSWESSRANGAAKPKPYSRKPSSDALKWADQQLKQMTLDEKIGQLIAVGINATFLNQNSEAFKLLRHQIVDNHVGGIVLFRGPVYESVMI